MNPFRQPRLQTPSQILREQCIPLTPAEIMLDLWPTANYKERRILGSIIRQKQGIHPTSSLALQRSRTVNMMTGTCSALLNHARQATYVLRAELGGKDTDEERKRKAIILLAEIANAELSIKKLLEAAKSLYAKPRKEEDNATSTTHS